MKLYTEEHLKLFYQLGKFDGIARRETDVEEEIKNHLPIELPSDDEIEEGSRNYIKGTDLDTFGQKTFFKAGAKWVINHIKQQDNGMEINN